MAAVQPVTPAAGRASQTFRERFGHLPLHVVAAPGRVNLIGEHTDYNDGFVLPMAIDRETAIAARPVEGRVATVWSAGLGETATFDLSQPIRPGTPAWANYVGGVLAGVEQLGHSLPAFEAVIESDVPLGGGLSSSAALEVAAATLAEVLLNLALDPIRKALLCQRAEHEFAGVPTGIMDQFTAVMAAAGHALLIDCRLPSAELVPMRDPAIAVLIVNTNVRHDLATGEYARRRAECHEAARRLGVTALRDVTTPMLMASTDLDRVLERRARHVVSENVRTLQAATALRASDWPEMGALMYASHASLKDDYEVSCPELDAVVDIAQSIGVADGVCGARMTGGGFGGSAVCLVRTEAVEAISGRIREEYERRTNRMPTLFVARPGAGARVLPERSTQP